MEPWSKILALSAGGVLGVNARYWLGHWINQWAGARFPWATFTINISGAFAIGFIMVALAHWLPHPNLRLMVVTGFLGGYTTFSTFAFESATLWERGEPGLTLANLAGSAAVGFVAVLLGIGLARAIVSPSSDQATTEKRSETPARDRTSRHVKNGQDRAPILPEGRKGAPATRGAIREDGPQGATAGSTP